MPVFNPFDTPGFREAVKKENDVRDAAFLELPTSICGLDIRPLTPRDLLVLDALENPIAWTREEADTIQVGRFLWFQSVNYRPRAKLRQFLHAFQVLSMDRTKAIDQIDNYFKQAFHDAPGKSGRREVPYVGWAAHFVDQFAAEYGWTRREILDCPLAILYQQRKCISKRIDPGLVIGNPSDRIIGDHFRLHNERLKLVQTLKARLN